MLLLVRHACYAEHRLLPQIHLPHFRNGDIKFIAQPIFQAEQHLPFRFQRVAVGKIQFNRAQPNNHASRKRRYQAGTLQLQLRRHFINGIDLEDVVGLQIAEILDTDSAFIPLLHFPHIILKPAQRI